MERGCVAGDFAKADAPKIGVDFHGVISGAPEKFARFCREVRKYGVLVYVISGGPRDVILAYLKEHKIEFDEVWVIVDSCEAKGEAVFFDDGSFQVPTEIWNRAKAEYCAKEGILFHIDDSPVYGRYFAVPYCQYDIKDRCCEVKDGLKINFDAPEQAARQVADLVLKTFNQTV